MIIILDHFNDHLAVIQELYIQKESIKFFALSVNHLIRAPWSRSSVQVTKLGNSPCMQSSLAPLRVRTPQQFFPFSSSLFAYVDLPPTRARHGSVNCPCSSPGRRNVSHRGPLSSLQDRLGLLQLSCPVSIAISRCLPTPLLNRSLGKLKNLQNHTETI